MIPFVPLSLYLLCIFRVGTAYALCKEHCFQTGQHEAAGPRKKGSNMNTRNVENRLALVGAMLVLIGVTFAASSAFADDVNDVSSTPVPIHTAAVQSVIEARKANHAAVVNATTAIVLGVERDLDIRLSARKLVMLERSR